MPIYDRAIRVYCTRLMGSSSYANAIDSVFNDDNGSKYERFENLKNAFLVYDG